MKRRIFFYGLGTRLIFVAGMWGLWFLSLQQVWKDFSIGGIAASMLVLVITFAISFFVWRTGIFADWTKNKVVFSDGGYSFSIAARFYITDIKQINIEKEGNSGYCFVVTYKSGRVEKVIHRVHYGDFFIWVRYRRIKRQLEHLNALLEL